MDMFGLSFINFNLFEGGFWIFCSLIALLGVRFKVALPRFWYLLALDFLLFGISDFVEAYYPVSFLDPGGEWLFAWKIICVLVFVACFAWYLVIMIKKH
jgi:hypothetical protein